MLARSILTGAAFSFSVALALLVLASGCGMSEKEIAQQRSRFLLTAEPEDIQSISEVRDELKGERDVVLVGQIGPRSPFTVGRATFRIVDPATLAEPDPDMPKHDHSHLKEGEECPFCAKAKEGEMAVEAQVQFCDERGEVLPIDARQLFSDLQKDSTVVVKGRAKINQADTVVVNAKGLYVRK